MYGGCVCLCVGGVCALGVRVWFAFLCVVCVWGVVFVCGVRVSVVSVFVGCGVCVFRGGYMYACGVFLRVMGVFVCVLCVLCICVWFCLCGLCICAVCVVCV